MWWCDKKTFKRDVIQFRAQPFPFLSWMWDEEKAKTKRQGQSKGLRIRGWMSDCYPRRGQNVALVYKKTSCSTAQMRHWRILPFWWFFLRRPQQLPHKKKAPFLHSGSWKQCRGNIRFCGPSNWKVIKLYHGTKNMILMYTYQSFVFIAFDRNAHFHMRGISMPEWRDRGRSSPFGPLR